jgi:hypothetical protein
MRFEAPEQNSKRDCDAAFELPLRAESALVEPEPGVECQPQPAPGRPRGLVGLLGAGRLRLVRTLVGGRLQGAWLTDGRLTRLCALASARASNIDNKTQCRHCGGSVGTDAIVPTVSNTAMLNR